MSDETTRAERLQEAVSRRHLLERAALAGAGMVAGAAAVALGESRATAQIGATPTFSPSLDMPFSVRRFGGKGDGVTDDTRAAQAAIDAAIQDGGGRVHFPAGNYRITRSLRVASVARLDITGEGWSSTLLHENDEPLLLWPEKVSCRECSIRHLRVLGSGKDKSVGTPVVALLGGVERAFFEHVLLMTGADNKARMGSGFVTRGVADTSSFSHCLIWGAAGTGIEVAGGSEVRIFGGRIVGSRSLKKENIGILLAGGNGGVHIVTTDTIGLHTGLQIGGAGGASNREIFITHASFDSSIYGVRQFDNAYLSIAGCWAASCDEAQIQLEPTALGALLSINGGTIFNGGAYGRPGAKNGLVVRAGSFNLTGVNVRNNQGAGILVEGEGVGHYAISGCQIFNNGTGAILRSGTRAVTGNVFTGNETDLVDEARGDNPFVGNIVRA